VCVSCELRREEVGLSNDWIRECPAMKTKRFRAGSGVVKKSGKDERGRIFEGWHTAAGSMCTVAMQELAMNAHRRS
jgi:hypothetical protein